MKNLIKNFQESARNIKSLKVLAITAVLIALYIILENLRIQISAELKITFSYIAFSLIGILFGPTTCITAGFVADIMSFFLSPSMGGFFPGYTLNTMLAGLIYGVGLYNQKITFLRVIITRAIINVFINIFMNAVWLSLFTGKAVYVLMIDRTIKNVILLPLEAILLFIVAKAAVRVYDQFKLKKQ